MKAGREIVDAKAPEPAPVDVKAKPDALLWSLHPALPSPLRCQLGGSR